jgi:glycerol-3-phosphate acyltransferase PlsY
MDPILIKELLILLAAYMFGSIPFSVLLGTKIKGIDVREHGSGNPGGTNSIRWLGKTLGLSIVFLDAFKGGLIILLVRFGVLELSFIDPLLFGVVGAIGHVYPVFLKFKGGKAVAATGGMLVAYNPIWALICIVVFFIVIKISKFVSIGSTSIPITMILLSIIWSLFHIQVFQPLTVGNIWLHEIPYFIFMFVLIVYRHQSNYRNIKNGIEPTVNWAEKKAA